MSIIYKTWIQEYQEGNCPENKTKQNKPQNPNNLLIYYLMPEISLTWDKTFHSNKSDDLLST